LGGRGVEDEREAAELVDPDGEGHPGAGRGLVEEHRHGAALERARGDRAGLELERELEDGALGVDGQVVVAQEMGGHAATPAVSRTAGRSARKPAACSWLRTKGGARRTASGATGLTM